MIVWLAVAACGGAGAVARFLVDGAVTRIAGGFPWGTFVVNVSGSLVIGLLSGLALRGDALLVAGTATLGSYTTFSTWMLETRGLGVDGRRGAMAANVLVSVAAGFAAVAAGRAVGGG